jgi:hypothetical protein
MAAIEAAVVHDDPTQIEDGLLFRREALGATYRASTGGSEVEAIDRKVDQRVDLVNGQTALISKDLLQLSLVSSLSDLEADKLNEQEIASGAP